MLKNKKYLSVLFGVIIVAFGIFIPSKAFACTHEEFEDLVTIVATCTEKGQIDTVCTKCNAVLESREIEPTGHNVINYKITTPASKDKNGVQSGTCEYCGLIFTKPYICSHSETYTSVVEEPSCYKEGIENVICKECNTVINSNPIEKVEHSFGEWNIGITATPISNGEMYRVCANCGEYETKSYSVDFEDNSIYIPETEINNHIVITSFTQAGVDGNDLVYAYAYDFGLGQNDPFVLGHNYGTMQYLHNVKVGQNIYIKINGNLEIYRVVISEFGMQNADWTDIIGQSSGLSIFTNLETKTLHMYTCYGDVKNGRWMVLAELISG